MPTDTLSLPKNRTARFLVKISQDGNVLPPPVSIASSSDANSFATVVREADQGGRATYAIAGVNQGTANISIGSGSGALEIAVTVTPAVVSPLVFERDGDYTIT